MQVKEPGKGKKSRTPIIASLGILAAGAICYFAIPSFQDRLKSGLIWISIVGAVLTAGYVIYNETRKK